LQFAQANTHAKNCKRACLSAIVGFADTKKTKSFKNKINSIIGLKKYLKPLKDNNAQLVTKAICNKGFSGNLSILPRIKFRVGGQASSPQSLTAYSLDRCI